MIIVLALSTIPAVLAAGFESAGFTLVAGAGLLWMAALFACSKVPVVIGRANTLNESLGTLLSVVAAATATAGVLMIVLQTL